MNLKKDDVVVIKLWSNILMSEKLRNGVNEKIIENISNKVKMFMEKWIRVVLVSSWAVWLWKDFLWINEKKWISNLEFSQICSSIWQPILMKKYQEYFDKNSLKLSQVLLTRRDFENIENFNSMKNVIFKTLNLWIIPIINENDVLTQEELNFSDNDQLSAYVAKMINAKCFIILSNIDWLLDFSENWNWWIIRNVNKIDEKILSMVKTEKSSFWKWWMLSKIETAEFIMDLWITMFLWNWKKDDILDWLFSENFDWTIFQK